MLFRAHLDESWEMIQNGKVPNLSALQLHNGTVYRWNRPCYGISDTGLPHLRIENPVMPSGPTVIDEMANMAFWLGAMIGLKKQYGDIRSRIDRKSTRLNSSHVARYGIDTTFNWLEDQKIN